jgi:hypothetical protein
LLTRSTGVSRRGAIGAALPGARCGYRWRPEADDLRDWDILIPSICISGVIADHWHPAFRVHDIAQATIVIASRLNAFDNRRCKATRAAKSPATAAQRRRGASLGFPRTEGKRGLAGSLAYQNSWVGFPGGLEPRLWVLGQSVSDMCWHGAGWRKVASKIALNASFACRGLRPSLSMTKCRGRRVESSIARFVSRRSRQQVSTSRRPRVGASLGLFGGICQEQDQRFVRRVSFGGREHCAADTGPRGRKRLADWLKFRARCERSLGRLPLPVCLDRGTAGLRSKIWVGRVRFFLTSGMNALSSAAAATRRGWREIDWCARFSGSRRERRT